MKIKTNNKTIKYWIGKHVSERADIFYDSNISKTILVIGKEKEIKRFRKTFILGNKCLILQQHCGTEEDCLCCYKNHVVEYII